MISPLFQIIIKEICECPFKRNSSCYIRVIMIVLLGCRFVVFGHCSYNESMAPSVTPLDNYYRPSLDGQTQCATCMPLTIRREETRVTGVVFMVRWYLERKLIWFYPLGCFITHLLYMELVFHGGKRILYRLAIIASNWTIVGPLLIICVSEVVLSELNLLRFHEEVYTGYFGIYFTVFELLNMYWVDIGKELSCADVDWPNDRCRLWN